MEMNEKPHLMTLFLFVIHQYRRNYREKATLSVGAALCRRNNITETKQEKPPWVDPMMDQLRFPCTRREQKVTASLGWH